MGSPPLEKGSIPSTYQCATVDLEDHIVARLDKPRLHNEP